MKTAFCLAVFILIFMIPDSVIAQDFRHKGSYACSARKSDLNRYPDALMSSDAYFPKAFDVIKYELDIDIWHCYQFPYPHNFTGEVIITFRADSVLNSVTLDAANASLSILSVGLSASSFTHNNNQLILQLNQSIQPGQQFQVSIQFDHLNVDDNAFYVKNGFVFTDCEPEGARRWFPCYDKPSDKAQWKLTTKVPSSVKLGSNGILQDSVKVADTIWYTWLSEENVATYLMVISSRTNYNLDIVNWVNPDNPAQIVPIRFYYNPGENPSFIQSQIGEITTFMSQTFSPHPFPKNGFATLNDEFTWGGMENQTLTSLCQNCWDENLVVHEYAHQWFGDMITCATWADLWLNEGFATYSEGLWLEHKSGYSAYKQDVLSNANYYLSANPGWAISNPDWAVNTPSSSILFNYAITYCKAATILHMLRYCTGDSLFFEILSQYASHPDLQYESATIPDFVEVVNSVTGEDYNWFFDQWLYTPNHPVYNNTYSFKSLGNNQWAVYFQASQVQTNTGFFKMPVNIRVLGQEGLDTTFSVMNDVNPQNYMFIVDKQPMVLFFDQANDIVIKNSTLLVGETDPIPTGMNFSEVYPNPATGSFCIDINFSSPGMLQRTLTDATGRTVRSYELLNLEAGSHRIPMDIQGLKPGIYFLKLGGFQGQTLRKFVVSR